MKRTSLLMVVILGGFLRASGVVPGKATEAALPSHSSLEVAIAHEEYVPHLQRGLLSAPNRAQGLRLNWADDGLAISSRDDGAPVATLSTVAFGRAGGAGLIGPSTVAVSTTSRTRVERTYAAFTEWWDNRAEGLEHGWTLHSRPVGEGALVVQVSVKGAAVSVAQNVALLTSPRGTQLEYAKLEARDARDRALPASLVASADGLRIEVDDTDAVYPLVIDPLLTTAVGSTSRIR